MATHDDYPGASSKTDRHGRERWRYRGKGRGAKEISLPGQPGESAFEAAYLKAAQGARAATVTALPGGLAPKSFGHAFVILKQSPEWLALDELTHSKNIREIETFLAAKPDATAPLTWRDVPVEYLTIRHIRDFLKPYHARSPTKAKHLLVGPRKLIRTAINEEWTDYDPSYGLSITIPATEGHRPWPREYREQFEAYHNPGTAARTAYALALWLGNRRSDVAHLRWDQIVRETVETADGGVETVEAFDFRQRKNRKRNGGKEMFLKITASLAEALSPLDRSKGGTVLKSSFGEPYSEKALGNRMREWCEGAGIPKGYSLHGLRKSLGVHLAESGASARQIQDVLGHSSMAESDKYVRMANKKRLATDALNVVEEREARRAARPKLAVVK